MHIILAVAGAIITILILLRRLGDAGITIDSLNPFAWYRKHQWLKKYHTKPLFNIEDPKKVAALLIVAVAKADGLISIEEKKRILQLFQEELGYAEKDASGLFTSSAFFLKDEVDILPYLNKILQLSAKSFTHNQISFTIECMQLIARLSAENSTAKNQLIKAFSNYFEKLNNR